MKKKKIDDYICLCSKVKKTDYVNYIKKNKKIAIEEIFQRLKVGVNCSACRIELEKEYLLNQNNSYSNYSQNFLLKNFLIRKISLLSPKKIFLKKKILKQVAPIFSGPHVDTKLIVSNFSIGNFGKYNVPFTIKVKSRDKSGNLIEQKKFLIEPENRLIYKLNVKGLINNNEFDQVGSLWTESYGQKFGYIGVTRPHIRLTTKSSISTIHMQHGRVMGVKYSTMLNMLDNHYLSIVNLKSTINNFKIHYNLGNERIMETSHSINPYASELINLTENLEVKNKKFLKADFIIEHSGILRRNIIIRNNSSHITSIDHI